MAPCKGHKNVKELAVTGHATGQFILKPIR